ncbi:hypothetical protein FRB99_004325 [Tulasnella sp. 403]|nr:hypothetical protein FRB99_004325 [Tulasnella sp. 403]
MSKPPSFPSPWVQHSHRKIPFFTQPTHITFHDESQNLRLGWNSRAHRKGANPAPTSIDHDERFLVWMRRRASLRFWGWDLGDISWWVAQLFLIGSVFWCANGVMSFNFFTVTTSHIALCEAVTAFVGGTLFWIGGYLSYVESLNPARHAEFGWEIENETKTLIEPSRTTSALGRRRRHFGKHVPPHSDSEKSEQPSPTNEVQHTPKWRWVGTDWSSVGYVANLIQFFGASIFWVSVLCGLPGILPDSGAQSASDLPAKSLGLWVGLYWVPQVIGAPCFVISGAMFMFEVQRKWYIPKINSLGWHVGFWNMIGGFGFWFCGIFGIWREVGGKYQKWGTAFSTYWGSWAFLLGSYIQLFETLNKR